VRKALLSLAILVALAPFALGQSLSQSDTYEVLTGDPVSLASLIGQELIVGDKVFAGFDLFGITSEGGALGPDPSLVFIQGVRDIISGDYGLRMLMAWNAGSGQFINANISFTVAILEDPEWAEWYLKDVKMVLTGASATGNGVVNASETVWDGPVGAGELLAALSCSSQEGDGGAYLAAAYDWVEAGKDPAKKIWVRKDISITGGVEGAAHLSEVFQFYSQIPEPATLTLLAGGACLVGLSRRKR
jgi:hypothetical protein